MIQRINQFLPVFLMLMVAAALSMLLSSPAKAAAKLKVVTATTDMAVLAEEVGGDHIEVVLIARGYQVRTTWRPSPASC